MSRSHPRRTTTKPPPFLALFAQPFYHRDCHIVGDERSLIGLRDAIDRALASGNWEKASTAQPGDDEGYRVLVLRREPEDLPAEPRLRRPYTEDFAKDPGESLGPEQLTGANGRVPWA